MRKQSHKRSNFLGKNTKKYSIGKILIGLALLSIVIFILIQGVLKPWGERYVFYYPALNNASIKKEIRYLKSKEKKEGKIALFISEYILGPTKPQLSGVFDKHTQIISCILRDKTLYISLSGHALEPLFKEIDYLEAKNLFKKNVCTNFKNIDKIYMYIDGIRVFEENDFVSVLKK